MNKLIATIAVVAMTLGIMATAASASETTSDGGPTGCYHSIRVERPSGTIVQYVGSVDASGRPLAYNASQPENYEEVPSVTVSLRLERDSKTSYIKCGPVSVGERIDTRGSTWTVVEIL